MTFQTIEVERSGRVATVRFNRPAKLNALSDELKAETVTALDALSRDEEVRAVILTGNGRAFSAGYELGHDYHLSVSELRDVVAESDTFALALWRFPKPLIAAVHGYCLAGGCEIAMVCDLTIASESSVFGEPEIRFGVSSTLVMPWVLPMKIAKELLLEGGRMTAQRAYEVGLVNQVVSDDQLQQEALRRANILATIAPAAARFTKRGINATYEQAGMLQAIAYHSELLTHMMQEPSEEKDRFLEISTTDGVRAAVAWRDEQFRQFEPRE